MRTTPYLGPPSHCNSHNNCNLQDKYKRKKAKKYIVTVTVRRPTARAICQVTRGGEGGPGSVGEQAGGERGGGPFRRWRFIPIKIPIYMLCEVRACPPPPFPHTSSLRRAPCSNPNSLSTPSPVTRSGGSAEASPGAVKEKSAGKSWNSFTAGGEGRKHLRGEAAKEWRRRTGIGIGWGWVWAARDDQMYHHQHCQSRGLRLTNTAAHPAAQMPAPHNSEAIPSLPTLSQLEPIQWSTQTHSPASASYA